MPKFAVTYTFHGSATETIEAASLEEAKAAIESKVEDDNFDIDADEIDDVDYRVAELHPITRDGRELWTTYVRAGDVRGHASAIATSPLFAHQEAAPAVSEGGGA